MARPPHRLRRPSEFVFIFVFVKEIRFWTCGCFHKPRRGERVNRGQELSARDLGARAFIWAQRFVLSHLHCKTGNAPLP